MWYDRGNWKLYPNIYTILVGRPGIGKGQAINPIFGILREAGVANILSDKLTIEYILEKLSKGFPTQTVSPGSVTFGIESSCVILASELSVFMRNSSDTLPVLNELWDAKDGKFQYGTRGKGLYEISNPCQSLLGGSAPEYLVKSIPSDAVGGGFTRRVNFVYAKESDKYIPFPTNHAGDRNGLINDLRYIHSNLRGEFHLDSKAKEFFVDLYGDREPKEFDDEATTAYKTSKWAHATKLAIGLSAARSDDKVIRKQDLEAATAAIEKLLGDLPMVFRAVGESDLVAASDRILRYLELKGYATRREILNANWRHVSTLDLETILTTFVQGGMIAETVRGNAILYSIIPQRSKP